MSILDCLLVVDRERRRVSRTGNFAVPAIHEQKAEENQAPFLVSNMRCRFVGTKIRPNGVVWAGFSPVPTEDEDLFLPQLFVDLWSHSVNSDWGNRKTTLQGAELYMKARELTPTAVVVRSQEDFPDLGVEVKTIYELGALPKGCAILFAETDRLGSYVRSDTNLALLFKEVDATIVLVGPDGLD